MPHAIVFTRSVCPTRWPISVSFARSHTRTVPSDDLETASLKSPAATQAHPGRDRYGRQGALVACQMPGPKSRWSSRGRRCPVNRRSCWWLTWVTTVPVGVCPARVAGHCADSDAVGSGAPLSHPSAPARHYGGDPAAMATSSSSGGCQMVLERFSAWRPTQDWTALVDSAN